MLSLLVGGVAWASHSVVALVDAGQGNAREFAIVYVGAFLLVAWQTTLAYLERPVRLTGRQQARVERLRVTVNVPVHNEAPKLLAACLWSLLAQTRLPQRVQVVVNGCSIQPYHQLLAEWRRGARVQGVQADAVQIGPASKRLSHLTTFRHDPADIFVTIDSDTVLDRNALAEGLKPFADPRIGPELEPQPAHAPDQPVVRHLPGWPAQLAVDPGVGAGQLRRAGVVPVGGGTGGR